MSMIFSDDLPWGSGAPPISAEKLREVEECCKELGKAAALDRNLLIAETFSILFQNEDAAPDSTGAVKFHEKLRQRGFTDPSEEAQQMNLEDHDRKLRYE